MADVKLTEDLFQAMDVLIKKRIENLPYDKTILATIEDNSEVEEKGYYIVNDGGTIFQAYSSDTSFSIGERVYVSIPQGDYNQQKNIIGRYLPEGTNATPIGYVDPMTSFVDITGNLFTNEEGTFYLIANGPNENTGVIWRWIADNENTFPLKGFDTLGLSGAFSSTVGKNQTLSSGAYGLKLDIIAQEKSTQVYETDNRVYYSFKLDSSRFFGDPYNFETYYQHSDVLDLKARGIERIDAMQLTFYQDNNFRDDSPTRELISPNIEGDWNLSVNNIILKLGYSLDNYQTDTVLLYTFDPNTYVNQITDNIKNKYFEKDTETVSQEEIDAVIKTVNQKTLHCRWIHFGEDGIECYGQEGSELPESAEILWYRYKVKEQTNEQYSTPPGVFWDEVLEYKNRFDLQFDPDFTEYHEMFKVLIKNPHDTYIEQSIENDNGHLEAERWSQAALNLYSNYDPLIFLKLYFTNKYQNNSIFEKAKLQAELDTLNESFAALLAGSDAESKARSLHLINEIVEIFKNWLNNFKTYRIRLIDSSMYSDIADKLRAEYNVIRDFFLDNYIRISNFNFLVDLDNYYLKLSQLMSEYIEDKPNFELVCDEGGVDVVAYQKIIQKLNNIQAEINKDPSVRDYTLIKSLFVKLEQDIQEQADFYYKKWLGFDETGTQFNEPSDSWLLTETDNEKKYKQVFNYSYFANNYQTWNVQKESIETSIKASQNFYESESLEFLNEDPEVALVKLQTIKNLKLETDIDGYNGIYRFYNDDGTIINKAEASRTRKITAKYTTLLTGDSRIDTAEKIIWKIPIQSTMIEYPEEGKEYNLYDKANPAPTEVGFSFGEYYIRTSDGYILSTEYDEGQQYFVRNNVEIDEDEEFFYVIKTAPLRDKAEYGVEEADSTEFLFRVKDFYSVNARNNTIYCEIVKNNKNLLSETTLTFGVKGTIGTDYTFILQYEGNLDGITYKTSNIKPFKVLAKVFDYQGNDCSDRISGFAFSWYSEGNGGLGLTTYNDQPYCQITQQPNKTISDCAHYILQVRATNKVVLHAKEEASEEVGNHAATEEQEKDFEVMLSTQLPIVVKAEKIQHKEVVDYGQEANIISNDPNYVPTFEEQYPNATYQYPTTDILRYDGNYSIIYNTAGTNPTYYKDPFKLWYWDELKKKSREFEFVQWDIIYGDDCFKNNNIDLRYYPIMNNINSLTVPSMYIEKNGKQITVCGIINGQIIFLMPLYVSVQVYNSALLNSWNGGLTLNKENGTIMSAMMGAGYKDDSNKFYGVLMGRMSLVENGVDLNPSSYYSGTGLYGYNAGEKSFGLNINGKAFFGKSGRGQILINGDKGEIQSASYKDNSVNEGMKIDLDDGIIDIKGKHVNGSQSLIHISPGIDENNHVQDYFSIKSESGQYLIQIAPSLNNSTARYYLQSEGYADANGQEAGVRFDLQQGKLNAYNFEIRATQRGDDNIYAGSYIRISSSGSPYFQVHYCKAAENDDEHDISHNLIEITKNSFVMESPSWIGNGTEQGMQINLTRGSIYNYGDFILKATNAAGSFVSLSSTGDYFKIHRVYGTNNEKSMDLVRISDSIFQIKSADYEESRNHQDVEDILNAQGEVIGTNKKIKASGAIIDFGHSEDGNFRGKCSIRFYNEAVQYVANEKSTGFMYLDGAATHFPLNIYNRFKVHWDGTCYCTELHAQDGGVIGPFTISKTALYTGASTLGGSGIYLGSNGLSVSNGVFKVDSDGKLTTSNIAASGGSIGGFTLSEGVLSSTSTTIGPSGVTTNNLQATGGKIQDCEIVSCTITSLKYNGEDVAWSEQRVMTAASGMSNRAEVLSSSTTLEDNESETTCNRTQDVTLKQATNGRTVTVNLPGLNLNVNFEAKTASISYANNVTTATGTYYPNVIDKQPVFKYKKQKIKADKVKCTTHLKNSFTKLEFLGKASALDDSEEGDS